jgi:hypothetical protein
MEIHQDPPSSSPAWVFTTSIPVPWRFLFALLLDQRNQWIWERNRISSSLTESGESHKESKLRPSSRSRAGGMKARNNAAPIEARTTSTISIHSQLDLNKLCFKIMFLVCENFLEMTKKCFHQRVRVWRSDMICYSPIACLACPTLINPFLSLHSPLMAHPAQTKKPIPWLPFLHGYSKFSMNTPHERNRFRISLNRFGYFIW